MQDGLASGGIVEMKQVNVYSVAAYHGCSDAPDDAEYVQHAGPRDYHKRCPSEPHLCTASYNLREVIYFTSADDALAVSNVVQHPRHPDAITGVQTHTLAGLDRDGQPTWYLYGGRGIIAACGCSPYRGSAEHAYGCQLYA